MWESYHTYRLYDLGEDFKLFKKNYNFKKEVFFALLPFIDYDGDIKDPFTQGPCRDSFIRGVLEAECIDWNLCYYVKAKNRIYSNCPVAEDLIRKFLFKRYTG